MYFLYSVLMGLSVALLTPYFLLQRIRHGKSFGNFRERMGYLPEKLGDIASQSRTIWVHAVSVGEVLAARPLIDGLKKRIPNLRVLVSTTTATGQRIARDHINSADGFFYFPIDWPGPVRRAFRQIQPALIVILETEIWPNFLREAHWQRVPVIFVNSRISERSFRRFWQYRPFIGGFFARVLADGEVFLAQSREDARRLREMGAPTRNVEVTGNLKYDHEPPAFGPFRNWLARQIGDQERWPVLVAGSVVAGEEESVLAAYDIVQRQWRRTLLILAPRKPERFDAAVRIITERGWNAVRRSAIDMNSTLDERTDVLVLDSIGELAGLYSLADVTFIGGSLVRSGGHNILEPAWFSRPPVFGFSMENFRDIAARFSSAGAGIQVASGEELGKVWVKLIRDSAWREEMGRKGRALVEANRGATVRSLERIVGILETKRAGA